MSHKSIPSQYLETYFDIRVHSIQIDKPLSYDIYLVVNEKPTLFRKKGESITDLRFKNLIDHGGEIFLVPNDQRQEYLGSLKNIIKDPDTTTEDKSKFIKESAYLHLHDLFTKKEIAPVITEAKSLVEEMVSLVSTDVEAVSNLMRLSIHDYYTYNHCVDVSVYSIALAKKIFGNDKNMLLAAGMGGFLHDIGKRKINWGIINKSSALTEEEWKEIKNHPRYGKECLEEIPSVHDEAKLIVYQHHENFDGTGYPNGSKDDEISKLARLVSIADVFDALTTDRSYHKAVKPNEALNTMYSMQPGKFDPNIFKSFDKNFTKKGVIKLGKDFDPCQPQALLRNSRSRKTG